MGTVGIWRKGNGGDRVMGNSGNMGWLTMGDKGQE